MTDPYDLRARAVYDDKPYRSPYKTRSVQPAVFGSPALALLDEFMARPEAACHIQTGDMYQLQSARLSLRRYIDMRRLPLMLHTNKQTLTIHINKEATT